MKPPMVPPPLRTVARRLEFELLGRFGAEQPLHEVIPAAADAMFRYPDFFKVGISEAGNHDNREYEDDWGERYQGLLSKSGNGTNYDDQANQNFAKNLKGHLLLAHGTMDTNVPPYNTLLVVNELIKANKDFDLILLPNRNHGFGNEPYMVRRRWDYFVRNLLHAEPPAGYELHAPSGL